MILAANQRASSVAIRWRYGHSTVCDALTWHVLNLGALPLRSRRVFDVFVICPVLLTTEMLYTLVHREEFREKLSTSCCGVSLAMMLVLDMNGH